MSLRPPRAQMTPGDQAQRFNAYVAIGEEIEFRDLPTAPAQRFKTRSAATVLGGHTAVVWLEGKAGCVSVQHCRVPGMISRPWSDVQW